MAEFSEEKAHFDRVQRAGVLLVNKGTDVGQNVPLKAIKHPAARDGTGEDDDNGRREKEQGELKRTKIIEGITSTMQMAAWIASTQALAMLWRGEGTPSPRREWSQGRFSSSPF